MRLRTILHPTDLSAAAARALPLAVRLARASGATLSVFHAHTLQGESAAEGAAQLQAYVDRARTLAGDAVTVDLVEGRGVLPFDGIMNTAQELDPGLIVLGAHGHSRFRTLLMGSTAEKVVRHAPCDVVTVRADAPDGGDGPLSRLVVPVDFSPISRQALTTARGLGGDAATIDLVHVVPPAPPMYLAGDIVSYFELDPDLRGRVEERLQSWADEVSPHTLTVTEGDPALQIARRADEMEADLIVMTSRGLTGVEHLLLGSVTERVCRHATVPVYVARAGHGAGAS